MRTTRVSYVSTALGVLALASPLAFAGAHTWDVTEVFSSSDGTIQFVELRDPNGISELGVCGAVLRSNTKAFSISCNVSGTTTARHLLIGTAAFAALPGAPPLDATIPAGFLPFFFSVAADTVSYGGTRMSPYDAFTFTAGQLPTDGCTSLNKDTPTGPKYTAVNSPTNYAGDTGSVSVGGAPPAVPDGSAGSTGMTGTKLNPAGSSISISWDTATCAGATSHSLIYGQGSQLPTTPAGSYGLTGSACGLGASPPFVWNTTPSASDGTGLIWWLLVVKNGCNTEGSWGEKSTGAERNGPGTGGSSAQCGVTNKDASNACGH